MNSSTDKETVKFYLPDIDTAGQVVGKQKNAYLRSDVAHSGLSAHIKCHNYALSN